MLNGRNNRIEKSYLAYYGMSRLELLDVLSKELYGVPFEGLVDNIQTEENRTSEEGCVEI